MLGKSKVFFLLVVLIPSLCWGASVYIDPTCPSSGNGTTTTCGANGPFKTWSEVSWASGNSYLQKKGTTARELVTIGASSVTLAAYGSGYNPKILGSIAKNSTSAWTQKTGAMYAVGSTSRIPDGRNAFGATTGTIRAVASFTAAADGTISDFYRYGYSGGAGHVRVGLYADGGSGPAGHPITDSGQVVNAPALYSPWQWNRYAVATPISVSIGTKYWLGIEDDASTKFTWGRDSEKSSEAHFMTHTYGAWTTWAEAFHDPYYYPWRALMTTESGTAPLWYTTVTTDCNQVWRSTDGGVTYSAMTKQNDLGSLFFAGAGNFYYDSPTKRVYVYAATNPVDFAGLNWKIEVGQRRQCIYSSGRSDVTIDGIDTWHSNAGYELDKVSGAGICAASGSNITIKNLNSSYNYDHGISLFRITTFLVDNITADYNGENMGSSTPQNGQAVGIRVENSTSGTVSRNHVSQSGNYNILIFNNDAKWPQHDIIVEHNTLHDSNRAYLSNSSINWGAGLGIYGEYHYNITARYNYIYDDNLTNIAVITIPDNVLIYYNILKMTRPVSNGWNYSYNIQLDGYYGALPTNVKIYNNTCYMGSTGGSDTRGVTATSGLPLKGFILKNNIFYNASSGTVWSLDLGASGGSPAPDINNNIYYARAASSYRFQVEGIQRASFTAHKNAGYDANGYNADPKFVNAGSGDFHPESNSPGINKGANSVWSGKASITDYAGIAITNAGGTIVAPGGTVDIGAYEFPFP